MIMSVTYQRESFRFINFGQYPLVSDRIRPYHESILLVVSKHTNNIQMQQKEAHFLYKSSTQNLVIVWEVAYVRRSHANYRFRPSNLVKIFTEITIESAYCFVP